MERRIQQTKSIKSHFQNKFQDIPVFIAGDFNEESQNPPISEIMESSFTDLYSLISEKCKPI